MAALPAAAAAAWTLADMVGAAQRVTDRLVSSGFDPAPAREVQGMFAASARRLQRLGGAADAAPAKSFWVPGRVEVLGKHTDYAGGSSLLGAVNKGFAVVTTARDDGKCRIFTQFSDGRELQQELNLTGETAELERLRACETDQGGWAAYPAAAIQRLTSNFGIARGADISIECSLPEASGMSSSSAVICYMWMVLDAYNGVSTAPHERFVKSMGAPGSAEAEANLYTYLGNIENGKDFRPGQEGFTLHGMGGVGTFGGSEDHTAIMSCTKGELKMWSYCPTKHCRTIACDPDVRFVIAVSGAKAEKTGGAMDDYNDACLLAFWAAAAYAQGRAAAAGAAAPAKATAASLAALFPGVDLYNPNLPNLAECVRYERAANPGLAPAELRSRVSAIIEGTADTFKAGLPVMFEGILNCDGLDSDRITVRDLVVRFEQFFDESETIVGAAAEAFATRDYAALGRLVDDSHRFTVEKLRNTIPETAWLPRWARGIEEAAADGGAAGESKAADGRVRALAASAFGAGFGGSCWALVAKADAEAFRTQWREAYEAQFPTKPGGLTREFFVMSPGPGSFEV